MCEGKSFYIHKYTLMPFTHSTTLLLNFLYLVYLSTLI